MLCDFIRAILMCSFSSYQLESSGLELEGEKT